MNITASPASPLDSAAGADPLAAAALAGILDTLDAEVIALDAAGDVVMMNEKARRLLEPTAFGPFLQCFEEDAALQRRLLSRVGGSSTWMPFALTLARGANAGTRVPFRGRALALPTAAGPAIYILLMVDLERSKPLQEHQRLIRELNRELAKGLEAERRLTELLEVQRNLHRELVHRVKNNLALLASLIRLSQRQGGQQAAGPLREFERRLMSIAAVHDILDRNDESELVDADQMIDRIVDGVAGALAPPGVRIVRELAPVRLVIRDATPLALVINELLTNALKHAFPDGRAGTVSVGLQRREDGMLIATVVDDGVGTTKAREEGGTGSRIVRSLGEQLGGALERDGSSGTTWRLTFRPREVS